MEPIQLLHNTLKKHHQSLTNPRKIVFAALQDHEPQTMNQLVKTCANQIDRASIYRTIALFEKLGIVQRIQLGWKYKLELSDMFQHHHHHLTCNVCHEIYPLAEDELMETRLYKLAEDSGFKATNHLLEIQGVCSNCLKTA